MSCTRKSENGWNRVPPGTPLGAGLGVVNTRRVWQLAQPIWSYSGVPRAIAPAFDRSRGGGARLVMNRLKLSMSFWTWVMPPAQLPTASSVPAGAPAGGGGARSSQPAGTGMPFGADSVANAVTDVPLKQLCVVMPISFI